jgi:hypothetical protein
MVGDGDTVRVIAQVLENVFWAGEGSFGVDHPLMATALTEERGKCSRCGKVFQLSGELWIPDDGDQDSETMSIKITK